MKDSMKRTVRITIAIIIVILCMIILYSNSMTKFFYESSIENIDGLTDEVRKAINAQIESDYNFLSVINEHIKIYDDPTDPSVKNHILMLPHEAYISYDLISDSRSLLTGGDASEELAQINAQNSDNGVITNIRTSESDRYIASYGNVVFKDGISAWLLKKYDISAVNDRYTLNLLSGGGSSYIVGRDGTVIVAPNHGSLFRTNDNILNAPDEKNKQREISNLTEFINNCKSGSATLKCGGKEMIFSVNKLDSLNNCTFVSVVSLDAIRAQRSGMFRNTFFTFFIIVLCISGIILLFYRINKANIKQLENKAGFATHLYNSVPSGIVQITAYRPYKIIDFNHVYVELMGYGSAEELLNDRGDDLSVNLHFNDVHYTNTILDKVRETQGTQEFTNRLVRKDGSSFYAGGIFEYTNDLDGNEIIIAAFNDDTARIEQEKEKEKLATIERNALISGISYGYPLIVNANLTTNEYSIIYYDKSVFTDTVKSKTYDEFILDSAIYVVPDMKERFIETFRRDSLIQAFEEGRKFITLESKNKVPDSDMHWYLTNAIRVNDPDITDIMIVMLVRIIDESKAAEEQRQQVLKDSLANAKAANVAKSRFLSNMSHDIRTPMNAIIGMTTIAKNNIGNNERIMDCLNKITAASGHLLSLINDVLDMSKIESGKMAINNQYFSLDEFLQGLVEIIEPQVNAKELNFNVIANVEHTALISDTLRLNQIFINILSNSIKFTEAKGQIRFSIDELPSAHNGYYKYKFVISDTGKGMTQDFLKTIFDPFTREKDSIANTIEGTGLGMSITKNIVSLMNGTIDVASEVGKGSQFTIILEMEAQPENSQPEDYSYFKGKKVLIIDDDADVCDNVTTQLRSYGMEAYSIHDSSRAGDLVNDAKESGKPYDIIIIDWNMPGMNGKETIRAIRSVAGSKVIIAVLTAYDWQDIEKDAIEARVDTYIQKPFFMNSFKNAVNMIREKSEEEQQVEFDYSKYKFLLVEDNLLNQEILIEILGMYGANIETAENGKEAVDMFNASPQGYYDGIFMDIQMPVMDGYEAARQIRASSHPDSKSIVIIAMTANAFMEDVNNTVKAGMNRHIAKPIDFNVLNKTLLEEMPKK